MKFHAVMIGQELLQGKVQDLNLHFLARLLHQKGHVLDKVWWVQDHIEDIAQAMQEASSSGHIVVCSGGLGPTEDDLTKMAVAKIMGRSLSFCQSSFDLATQAYQRYQKTIGPDHPYAQMPEGLEFVANKRGIAPGLILWNEKHKILCAPGVPFEFQTMLSQDFLPLIEHRVDCSQQGPNFSNTLTVRTLGIAEEEIFLRRYPGLWAKLSQWGTLSSLPEYLGVTISLNLNAHSADELALKYQQAKDFFQHHPLSESIWSFQEGPIEKILVQEALAKACTLTAAESCTGGLIQSKLTSIAGVSALFSGGFVCYSEEQKAQMLGVDRQLMAREGVVSEAVATAMAQNARRPTGAKLSVSTTGIAGPSRGDEKNPVGSVWIGVSSPRKNYAQYFRFKGERVDIQERFARQALHLALKELRNLSSD